MKTLVFNLKKEYFEQIKYGHKTHEYREVKPYWTKRLKQKFDKIEIRLGYPKSDNKDRIITYPYRGFFRTTVNLMVQGNKAVYAFPLVEASK